VITIYTENQNEAQLVSLLSFEIDGFTLVPCRGYWNGKLENSIQIQIAANTLDRRTKTLANRETANRIARLIKNEFDQKEVLITEFKEN
jgi:tmRNA-binding protein